MDRNKVFDIIENLSYHVGAGIRENLSGILSVRWNGEEKP